MPLNSTGYLLANDGVNFVPLETLLVSRADIIENYSMIAPSWSKPVAYVSGENDVGQLGIGTLANTSVLTQLSGNWVHMSASGNKNVIGIKSDGTLWSWGMNDKGQLGLGNIINESIPIQIGINTNWSACASGWQSSYALDTAGNFWSWGYNNFGQLGQNTIVSTSSPVMVSGAWSSIVAGDYFAIMIKEDGVGSLYTVGQGIGGSANTSVPIYISSGWSFAAAAHSFAIVCDMTGAMFGIGVPPFANNALFATSQTPVSVNTGNTWAKVSIANSYMLAIDKNGALWGYGDNSSGQLGLGVSVASVSTFTQIGTQTDWIDCHASDQYSSCCIKLDGTLWCTGDNTFNQFGNIIPSKQYVFAQINNLQSWKSVEMRIGTSLLGIAETGGW